jgi:uncharacterized protein
MEERVVFESEGLGLQGLFERRSAAAGVVISHPHPLYGGDMYHPVIECIARAYGRRGFTTLRFNFRGVGQSQGRYDEGKGEQSDVRSALAFLAQSGVGAAHLAGYSFGAWINALAAQNPIAIRHMIMVSPPVALIRFASTLRLPRLEWIATGSQDEFAPPHLIQEKMAEWNPAAVLMVIPEADHFYSGALDQLETMLYQHLHEQVL